MLQICWDTRILEKLQDHVEVYNICALEDRVKPNVVIL